MRARDGRKIPIDDSAAPIKDEKENVTGAVLVFNDIIERKQAEWAVRNSEERFRSIFDQAFNLMWLLQPDGTQNISKFWWRTCSAPTARVA
ncbi:MAG: PAS domain S-box protein [Hormoscilla sp. GM7CHS1pb]|nr:PAS domain S-box protein [Hormoscilla sp. GM7CHS1pb]